MAPDVSHPVFLSLSCIRIETLGGHAYIRGGRQVKFLNSSNSSISSILPSFKKGKKNGLFSVDLELQALTVTADLGLTLEYRLWT